MTRREWLNLSLKAAAFPVIRGTAAESFDFPTFRDISKSAGLTRPVIYGGAKSKKYILETNGCGVAFYDFDHDGWPDLFVGGGSLIGESPGPTSIRLYKNNRNGAFTDVTRSAGLEKVAWVSGVTIGDYNNDGLDDLFLSCWGQNILYRNNGDGTFTDVTRAAGLLSPEDRWNAGCTFLDYDCDGHLDLFVSEYLKFDLKTAPLPGQTENCSWKGIPVNCGPKGLPTGRNRLYRNNGLGKFEDVSEPSGIAKVRGRYSMTAVAADFNDDGLPDIFVACDSTPNILYRNNGNGAFEDIALTAGVAYNEDGREQAGMGVAIGDVRNRGVLDIFKTHFADDTPALYWNDGRASFRDATSAAGLGAFSRYVGWGAGLVDLDNDGYLDLFWVNGNVYPELDKTLKDYPYANPRIVMRNLGTGVFSDMSSRCGPAILEPHSSRGCAFGDFNNDGAIDVLILNMNEPPSLLQNELRNNNRWLTLKLIGTRSNRTAIGASVVVRFGDKLQRQDVLGQSSFYSQNDLRLHFGLGSAARADSVQIRWPSGLKETYVNVESNRIVTYREGDAPRASPL